MACHVRPKHFAPRAEHSLLRFAADVASHVPTTDVSNCFSSRTFRFELRRFAVVGLSGGFLALFVEGITQVGLP